MIREDASQAAAAAAAAAAATARSDHERRVGGPPARQRWLGLARAVWGSTALLALGVLVASIPGYVLVARQGNYVGLVVGAPVGVVHILDVASALTSIASALVCLALAGVLVWRKLDDGMALFVSFYLLAYGVVMAGPMERLDTLIPGSLALNDNVLQPLLFVSPTVTLLVLFPNGRFVPAWTRWLVPLSIAWTPLIVYTSLQGWTDLGNVLVWWPAGVLTLLTVGAALYAQVYRYRRVSSQTERQQTKWAVLGLVWWSVLVVAEGVPYVLLLNWPPSAALPWWVPHLDLIWWLSVDIVPVTLAVAVLRSHLFDIDVLIRRTLIYGTVTAILAAIYFAVVLGAQSVVQAVTGETGQQPIFIVASTLLVATLFNPLRGQLQATIDRRFYRRKYDAARTLAAFGQTLRSEVDLAQLSEQLVAVVEETMQPASVALWLRSSHLHADGREWWDAERGNKQTSSPVADVPDPQELPSAVATRRGR
jgi:hypothetical protein